jgi:hypothetical protein
MASLELYNPIDSADIGDGNFEKSYVHGCRFIFLVELN